MQVHPVFRSAGTADVDDLAEGPYFYSPATPAARDRDRNRNRRAAAAAASAPPSMDDADAAHVARLRRLSNTYNFLRRAGSGCSPELEVLYNLVRVSDDVARATQSTGGKRKRAAEGVVAAMYEYERHLQQVRSSCDCDHTSLIVAPDSRPPLPPPPPLPDQLRRPALPPPRAPHDGRLVAAAAQLSALGHPHAL